MGFWHTGYIEFHEQAGLDGTHEASKTLYQCQHCSAQFDEMDDLRRHRFEEHPYLQPLFFIRGIELGTRPYHVSRAVVATDFRVYHSTGASLNGKTVSLERLPMLLSKFRNDRVKLKLENDAAKADFELVFRVADDGDLDGVESAFLKLAKKGTLTRASIDEFIDECRAFVTADAYCDGICQYLYGVLAKERSPDSSLPYDEYRQRFNRAADALLDYDRLIARIVRALVSFHFNHFADTAAVAPAGRLRSAARRFLSMLEGKEWGMATAPGRKNAPEDLLTDHETLRILRWAMLSPLDLSAEAGNLAALAKRDTPEFDRVKLRLLLAEGGVAGGEREIARRAARELIGNPNTAAWAERMLARLADMENTK